MNPFTKVFLIFLYSVDRRFNFLFFRRGNLTHFHLLLLDSEPGDNLLLVFLDLLRPKIFVKLHLIKLYRLDAVKDEEDEGQHAENKAEDSGELPVPGVASIRSDDVLLDGGQQQEPEREGDEILAAEAEVEHESGLPPAHFERIFLPEAGKLAHGVTDALDTAHGDVRVPVSKGGVTSQERVGEDNEELDGDESQQAVLGVSRRNGNNADDYEEEPEAIGVDFDRLCVVRAQVSRALIVKDPSDAEAL